MSSLTSTLKAEGVYKTYALQQLAARRVIAALPDNFHAFYNRAIEVLVKTDESRYMQSKPFMPSITLSYLDKLHTAVTTKHLFSIEIVSYLYACGLALPFSEKLSELWKQALHREFPSRDFKKLLRKLAKDMENAERASPDGIYAYMEDFCAVDKALAKALECAELDSPKQIAKHYAKAVKNGDISKFESLTATISITGIPVVLMYRKQADGSVMLVDGHIQGDYSEGLQDIVSFPHLASLSTVPVVLATATSGYVDRMSDYLDTDLETFLVTGTLAVPKSLRKQLKRNLPFIKNVKDLVAYILSDPIAQEIEPSPVLQALTAEFDSVFGVVNTNPLSPEFGTLLPGKFSQHRTVYEESALHIRKLKAKLQAIKTRRGKIKRADSKIWNTRKTAHKELKQKFEDYSAYAEQLKVDYKQERESLNVERRALREQRGERYLHFVASDIMGFSNSWEPINFGLKEHTRTHLSSLRFNALTHHGIVLRGIVPEKNVGNARVFTQIVKKAQSHLGDDYTVNGLYVQPNKTVNIGKSIMKALVKI